MKIRFYHPSNVFRYEPNRFTMNITYRNRNNALLPARITPLSLSLARRPSKALRGPMFTYVDHDQQVIRSLYLSKLCSMQPVKE